MALIKYIRKYIHNINFVISTGSLEWCNISFVYMSVHKLSNRSMSYLQLTRLVVTHVKDTTNS